MRIADLMTPAPIRIAPEAELADAVELMDLHDIRHLPVVEDEELVGIVSDRDLLAATGWKPSRLVRERDEAPGQVRDIMRADLVVVTPQESTAAAARRMIEHRVHALPVLEGGLLVGIVTDYDFLVEYLEAIRTGRSLPDADLLVSECMTVKTEVTSLKTTIADAFSHMRRADVMHLPVLDGERLVGILSDRDIRLGIGRGTSTRLPVQAICSRELVTVSPEQRLSDAVEQMVLHKIGAVPVAEKTILQGLLSSSDVLAVCATRRG